MPFGRITIAFGHSFVCAGVGTASYSAPEQLGASGRYGMAVDIFPLGLILMELCCTFATGEAFFHLCICVSVVLCILPSVSMDTQFSFYWYLKT